MGSATLQSSLSLQIKQLLPGLPPCTPAPAPALALPHFLFPELCVACKGATAVSACNVHTVLCLPLGTELLSLGCVAPSFAQIDAEDPLLLSCSLWLIGVTTL